MTLYILGVFAFLFAFNAGAVAWIRRDVAEGLVEPGSPAASPWWILWADAAIVAAAVAGWWV